MIEISKFSFENPRFLNLLNRQNDIPPEIMKTGSGIVEDVRVNGDSALNRYMLEFDQIDLTKADILVGKEEIEAARENVSPALRDAIAQACQNIRAFHVPQLPKSYRVSYTDGVSLERRYKPLDRVAVTVPGQMAPLLSTLYMNLIPAIVAGVPDLCILTKPKDGKIPDVLLYAADFLNVRQNL